MLIGLLKARRSVYRIAGVLPALLISCNALAMAQSAPDAAPSAVISGTINGPDGKGLASVSVSLRGPAVYSSQTHADGTFRFADVKPGIYRLTASRAGFVEFSRDDLLAVAANETKVSFALTQSSFSSLREIGRVSASTGKQNFNASTAAISVISQEQFIDQGQTQVMRVLNQTPGIITTLQNFGDSNGASMSSPQEVQIRGALPYETASLIDGHPVAVGVNGYFSPNNINPYLLQEVEIVKGPGAVVPDITYAIGGSINYRTLSPTVKPVLGVDLGVDNYGGVSSNFKATGTTLQGKLGYVLDYAVNGSPGPLNGNQNWYGSATNFQGGVTVNGKPVCLNAPATANCPSGVTGGNPNYIGSFQFYDPVTLCCGSVSTQYSNKSELAKLRYNFTPQTSLTASYLGSQSMNNGEETFTCSCNTFAPPSGYVAAGNQPQPGIQLPNTNQLFAPTFVANQEGLFQGEFRTAIGKSTLLARYYSGADNADTFNFPFGTTYTYQAQAYGGLYLGTNSTPTIWNGQTITVSETGTAFYSLTQDHFRGSSLEWDVPAGENLYSVSYDRNTHDTFAFNGFDEASSNPSGPTVPAGSGQTFQTFMLRGIWQLNPHIQTVFSNYFIDYTNHYSSDGGVTFQDASHAFYGPRLGFTWRPYSDTSARFALGSSIAPPYISLITVPAGPPQGNNDGAPTYYTQVVSGGTLAPETAFGWDLGVDHRFGTSGWLLSADLYRTLLQNQFLSTSQPDGTYTPTSGPNTGLTRPLFLTSVANLGHSEYSGFEFSMRRVVDRGFGFVGNLSLIRAFPYDIPAGFYNTAAGPNTTNLAILPNVNFQSSGNGYNGMADGRVPYAQGYGEVNYTARNHIRVALGATYYGSNNSYNVASFGVVQANATIPFGKFGSFNISANNLTGALNYKTYDLLNGTPEPLVGGLLGYTSLNNVGPTTFNIWYHYALGK